MARINKPLCIACFVLGAAVAACLTYVAATIHYGKAAAEGMLSIEQERLLEAGQRATKAYRFQSRPIAIYELSECLKTLERVEKMPDNPVIRRDSTCYSITLTHGRLAKLYSESGQADLSAEHIAEAIRCSKKTAHLVITNQAGVEDLVALWDKVIDHYTSPTNSHSPSFSP